ncbi:NAD(P)-dependent oxidoreductase [Microbacterium hominis]|uniref:NAD(P)-dependent oxidoreductase n=1 Tax=Microbacterium hominis TaxID=162426 RepID=UPI00168BDD5F|nr:NAD(P)-dependent oxidoreductase [Microbacterium hominis]QOC25171.1 NAD(P)-dependent oxidoreductase [Microbacterium hominis]QOC29206.1 NAD(P)-dependent oxidoreductase [Microbacterium hominis]
MAEPELRPAREIVVIGAGRMGFPIARRLADSGEHVHIVDVDPVRRTLAADFASSVSADIDAVTRSDVVVTVLPDVRSFEAVSFADDGLINRLRPGAVWIDLTSNDPRVAARAAGAHRSGAFVGAPMGGGPSQASDGTLTFWVGADDTALDAALPFLTVLARTDGIQHVGNIVTDGYMFKLLSNALWFSQVAAVSEAMAIAARSDIPLERFAPLLGASAARSSFTDEYVPRLLTGDYVESFSFARCVEELELVDQLAQDVEVVAPTLGASFEVHRRALERYGPLYGEMLAARVQLDGL